MIHIIIIVIRVIKDKIINEYKNTLLIDTITSITSCFSNILSKINISLNFKDIVYSKIYNITIKHLEINKK